MDNMDNMDNLDVIKWAFNFGYKLGINDFSEGIHINGIEIQRYFIDELTQLMEGKNINVNIPLSDDILNLPTSNLIENY
jgi:hypothetical protein